MQLTSSCSTRSFSALAPSHAALRASAQNPHLVVYEGSKGPGAGKHIVLALRRSRVPVRGVAAGAGAHPRAALRLQVQRVLHRRSGHGLHHARQLEDRGARGAEDRRPHGRVPALPGLRRRSDAAHRRLPRSRRPGGRVPHGDARLPDQAARREVRELRLAEQGRLRGRLRPADPRRNVGVALRHQPQDELAADPRAVAGQPSGPARREGRLGAVGWIHRRSAAAERHPRARPDPQRDDAGLAARARQAADARRLGAHLHVRLGQDRARLHDHARRVGGSAERRVPAHDGQRGAVGGRAREQHHG